mmetsp:Transcript_92630/g.155481  ORF Transcript_92630/g.155481 Transcript_92630/m.155481 type:complete len:84 (+) Transcript_92630:190-441(+)
MSTAGLQGIGNAALFLHRWNGLPISDATEKGPTGSDMDTRPHKLGGVARQHKGSGSAGLGCCRTPPILPCLRSGGSQKSRTKQ